ncbi:MULTISPECIES: SSI family serine proteinase inhibitor [Nonomuraea]|uniref:SSI family serine proteinase inhibitor n=2 Tax=Nonomuraea TaxID=83681 RepID=A0ABW1BMR7_9ACTN|nr:MULTISPECIES: SSI family serine proteinase inhibitor [Nonomuraea]MDA0643260.1 SSI family serine proteinase inhibitor [Nonomuraea ferruginea]TXK39534.1 protease inhibitor protein [Nonomuraea sp. C10]
MMKAFGAIALCGSLLTVPAPAVAASTPGAVLRILVTVKNGPTRTATLTCRPAGGTHRSASAACKLLARAGGDPARLVGSSKAACTREFRPAAVVVTGRWRGEPISFGRMYSNACLMKSAGGALFTP